jgi:hypothetical protein
MLFKRVGFVIVLIFVLVAASVFAGFLVISGQMMGVLKNGPVEVSSTSVVTAVFGLTGLVGIVLTYHKSLVENAATKARFVLYLNQSFLQDDNERAFFYKLDHDGFFFEPQKFAGSEDEKQLDRLLFKISFVGKLLKDGVVDVSDINFVRHIVGSTMKDKEVAKYLCWLSAAIPGHQSFHDAAYLVEQLYGRDDPDVLAIKPYLRGHARA